MHHRSSARRRAHDQIGPIYTGRRVLDEHGLRLGSIVDVVFAPGEYAPEYLIVDPGVLRRARCVPADGACQTADGDIVVSWDRDWFRLAPRASGRPTLTPRERDALRAHYA
jgi:hypothetical protein